MDDNVRVMLVIVALALVFLFLLMAAVTALVVRPWVRALLSGAPASILQILGMRLRGNPPMTLVDAYLALHHSGWEATLADVERAYIVNRTRVRTSSDLVEFVKAQIADEERAGEARGASK